MDAQQYSEAEDLPDPPDQFETSQFDPEALFEFYFTYGNTLGNLGHLNMAEKCLMSATEVTIDSCRVCKAWLCLLYWQNLYQAWGELEAHSRLAIQYGRQTGHHDLRLKASQFLDCARRGLDKPVNYNPSTIKYPPPADELQAGDG
ncbi:MAG: hypothetical protein AAFW75_25280 [Cyanobacteria bacterium J06636_16]